MSKRKKRIICGRINIYKGVAWIVPRIVAVCGRVYVIR